MVRRDRTDIEADILGVIKRRGAPTGKTAIVYGANLNFYIVKGHLRRMMEKGLVNMEVEKGREFYTVTDKEALFMAGYTAMRTIG